MNNQIDGPFLEEMGLIFFFFSFESVHVHIGTGSSLDAPWPSSQLMIGWMAGAIYGEGKYLWQGVHRWCVRSCRCSECHHE